MINRWIGIVTLGLMLSVNSALVLRDLCPRWLASDPPISKALRLQTGQRIETQYGIFNGEGQRIGTSWTQSSRNEDITSIQHRTILAGDTLPISLKFGALRLDTNMIYRDSDQVDEIRVYIYGLGFPIKLEGQHFPPDDFACRWQVGEERGDWVIPGSYTRGLGDIIRPFDSLTELTVGQSWRLELLNPLTGLFSDFGAGDMTMEGIYVRVTRLEEIEHHGQRVEAFVLEAENLRAWVSHKGTVMRQELTIPLVGTLVLVDEPYDDEMRQLEIQRTFRPE